MVLCSFQLTNTLGFLDNAIGARQMLRKIGRSHGRVGFLLANARAAEAQLDYFAVFALRLRDKLMPGLVEDVSKRVAKEGEDANRRVRFSHAYRETEVSRNEQEYGDSRPRWSPPGPVSSTSSSTRSAPHSTPNWCVNAMSTL